MMKMNKFFDMSICRYIGMSMFLALGSWLVTPAMAQSDTALNRSVTVERDFQPVIKAAGKLSAKPVVIETSVEPIEVTYSDFTVDVQPETTVQPLLSQPTRFQPGEPYNGYIRGGFGHTNTLFDFGYHLDDGKRSILDVYAHHRAQWGLRTLSRTKIGMDFTHPFSACSLYFGLNGGNIYYNKYGRFYDYSLPAAGAWDRSAKLYPNPSFTDNDRTSLWSAEVFLGVKSNEKADVQYRLQTGYQLFAKPGAVGEHQVRTHADFDWHNNEHHVGAVIYVQNNFLALSGNLATQIPDSLYRDRHNFRVEPYYAYEGRRIRLHLGVNIDLNLGRGHQHLSGVKDLSFAPSPHINIEAQIAKKWLTIYADVLGNQGLGSLQSYMEENRYSLIHAGIIHPCGAYTPVDAELGFRIRPYRDLLIEIHGGYAYMLDEDYWIATADSVTPMKPLAINRPMGAFIHQHTNYQRGKVGGQVNYHYQDIVRVNLHGDYYFWSGDTTVYDRPNWQLGLRVDGKINRHWSIYSDNHFAGSRIALATDGEHILKPTVEMDLGMEYNMWVGKKAASHKANGESSATLPLSPEPKPNLTIFAQINNFIHYKNDLYYGYTAPGINCLVGVTFRF